MSLCIDDLLNPEAFDHPVDQLELITTHISWIVLTGTIAYKIKRPVNFGFLDFSTPELRHGFCEREVRLNRELGSKVYIDVVSIHKQGSSVRVDGSGEPMEYAVRMHQFAPWCHFDHLLQVDALGYHKIDALAAHLGRLHDAARSCESGKDCGIQHDSVYWIQDTVDHLASLAPVNTVIQSACQETQQVLESVRATLHKRITEGFVRDCHGDLHLGNIIWRNNSVELFDRIEFNDDLRWIDIIDDIAFPFMDLVYHGRADLGWRLINQYLDHTGDYAGMALLPLFVSYRALVRAKVALLGNPDEPTSIRNAQKHAEIALDLLSPPNQALTITHGLSGSGKTTRARRLAEREGRIILRSDVARMHLSYLPYTASPSNKDRYSDRSIDRVYGILAGLADSLLARGLSLVIDATFIKRQQRDRFRALCANRGAKFEILTCQADRAELERRLFQRQSDASEADISVLDVQEKQIEALQADEKMLQIDSNP